MNLGIKLLVAEDDPNLGTILRAYLTVKRVVNIERHHLSFFSRCACGKG